MAFLEFLHARLELLLAPFDLGLHEFGCGTQEVVARLRPRPVDQVGDEAVHASRQGAGAIRAAAVAAPHEIAEECAALVGRQLALGIGAQLRDAILVALQACGRVGDLVGQALELGVGGERGREFRLEPGTLADLRLQLPRHAFQLLLARRTFRVRSFDGPGEFVDPHALAELDHLELATHVVEDVAEVLLVEGRQVVLRERGDRGAAPLDRLEHAPLQSAEFAGQQVGTAACLAGSALQGSDRFGSGEGHRLRDSS